MGYNDDPATRNSSRGRFVSNQCNFWTISRFDQLLVASVRSSSSSTLRRCRSGLSGRSSSSSNSSALSNVCPSRLGVFISFRNMLSTVDSVSNSFSSDECRHITATRRILSRTRILCHPVVMIDATDFRADMIRRKGYRAEVADLRNRGLEFSPSILISVGILTPLSVLRSAPR